MQTVLILQMFFEKRHADILRAIENFSERAKRNFALSEYQDTTNRKLKMYQMNRDGFAFLVMGFTGAKAEDWKLDFIEAFNKLENIARNTVQKPLTTLELLELQFIAHKRTSAKVGRNR